MEFNAKSYSDLQTYIDALRKYKFEEGYKPKHQILFDYYYFNPDEKEEFLKQYIHSDMYRAEKEEDWDSVIEEPIWEVYQFPLITQELCNMIIEEVEHFNSFLNPKEGPNKGPYATTDSMLDAIPGTKNYIDKPLGHLYFDIQWRYLKPILKKVWKHKVNGFPWSWVAKYEPTGQSFLEHHHDNCICASILSLNDDYEGGGTWFERQDVVVDRTVGWCTIHPSRLTHHHAGKEVTKGKRYILVTFIDE